MSRAGRWNRSWLGLLALCVVAFGAADAVLLHLATGYLGGAGFNGVTVQGVEGFLGFALASAVADSFLILLIWSALIPVLRVLRRPPSQILALAAGITLAVPVWINTVRFHIHEIVGTMIKPDVAWELAGGTAGSLAGSVVDSVTPDLLSQGILAGIVLAHGLAAFVLARLLEHRWAAFLGPLEPPRVRSVALGALAAGAVVLVLDVAPAGATLRDIRAGVARKPAHTILAWFADRATDVDLDGAGLVFAPRDPAPFDPTIHPYAIDRPGNGIDEDRIAGDHPVDFERLRPVPVPDPSAAATRRPHVLVIYLESFRADLLGRRFGDREVTPFLDRLAREGAASQHAYAHSPFTSRSRAQFFSGRLAPVPGEPTLIDDFAARGYRVAHFSGQDDSYAGSEALLGVARADRFYDARQDLARRTSRSTSQVSLQVSWKTLLSRTEEYLDHTDPSRPLFLYVNFVDTHFPYHHDELDDLLGVDPVDRADIRRSNVDAVLATYYNAAANVDLAIERLVGYFRRWSGGAEHVILVTSDHGQAFYEHEFLGHGEAADDPQSRVPLVVWGIEGQWPEPLGAADLRGLLLRDLGRGASGGAARLRFVPDPDRAVVQYLPSLARPRLFAVRRLSEVSVFQFVERRLEVLDAMTGEPAVRMSNANGGEKAALREVILNWEALRLEQAEADGDGSEQG